MARKLRIRYEGAIDHVTFRGNARHGTSGHVMQGRFGSTVVSGDAYLLRLSRHIHLNPVVTRGWGGKPFAERRDALRKYEWSSYRKYIGLAPAPPWLIREPLLAVMPGAGSPESRYRRYVEDGLRRPDEAFRLELERSPLALGPPEFRERMLREHGERGRGGPDARGRFRHGVRAGEVSAAPNAARLPQTFAGARADSL